MVGVQVGPASSQVLNLEDSLAELELLAETAGIEVLATLTQNLEAINSRTFIGSGKVEELKLLAEELDVGVILFDEELTPRHQRELEEVLGKSVKIIDRSALILDIFSQHARTREGMLQVELAQLEYRLPRLTRAWTHLARQAGGAAGRTGSTGGVGLRGPGETQLEVDRREIKTRIVRLKEELEKVREHRLRHREHRRKTNVPVVALVGYTNAGKSTLLNTLTNADIYVADKLFATLDSTSRQLKLSTGYPVVLSDTVGFISKLPHHLIASFKATLMEVQDADLLLHIVDVSDERFEYYIQQVNTVLQQIGADSIPQIIIFNKIDKVDSMFPAVVKRRYPEAILISAVNGTNIDKLIAKIEEVLLGNKNLKLKIPYDKTSLVSKLHDIAEILNEDYKEDGIYLEVGISKDDIYLVENYVI